MFFWKKRSDSGADVRAILPAEGTLSSGVHPTVWVALIGCVAGVAGAYLNYLGQTNPLKQELAELKRVQAATAAQPNSDTSRLQEELKKATQSLQLANAEADKWRRLAKSPASFTNDGADFATVLGTSGFVGNRNECATRLRDQFQRFATAPGVSKSVKYDSGRWYAFEYRRSTYFYRCGEEQTAIWIVVSPIKDLEEKQFVSQTTDMVMAQLEKGQ